MPFLDLARLHAPIRKELEEAFASVVAASAFVGSTVVADFEQAFAAAHGRAGAVGCGSGTDALTLALRSLGVGPGDEVVVPAMTFVATLEAVVHAGATPVIADVEPDSLLLSADTVADVRTARTRAVVPVHLYGHVVPFPTLAGWIEEGLVVVEDASHAHLATFNGQPVGTVGHAACFSFYPSKNLGALGDGGILVSDDPEMLATAAGLRNHGSSTKHQHQAIGWSSRLDGMQAAFLHAKLRHLPEWTEARRQLAAQYRSRLPDRLVPWGDGAVHHLVVARFPGQRDEVARALAERGVETGVHYRASLSDQPSCRPWARPCPVAESAAAEVLSLPIDPLISEADIDLICAAVHSIVSAL